jgi:hypothetical protein
MNLQVRASCHGFGVPLSTREHLRVPLRCYAGATQAAAYVLDPFRAFKRKRRLAGCPYARTAGKQDRSGRASAKRVALHCKRLSRIGREGP